MSKRRTQRDKRNSHEPSEDNTWLTVGWMLTVMTALVCELAALAVYLATRGQDPIPPLWGAMSVVLFFASLVVGLLSLLILPVVLKVGREPVPRPILIGALLVGAAPMAVLLVSAVR